MRFIDKVRLVFSNNFNERINAFLKGDDDLSNIGVNIDSETAMKYSAVFSCVRVLSETMASLPINVYKKSDKGDKEEFRDTPLYDLLHYAPNPEMTPFNFKEAVMMSLCLGGNGFVQKVKSISGQLLGLYPLEWTNLTVERDKTTKKLVYKVRGEDRSFSRDEIFHIPGLSLNGITGLTPIGYAAKAIELGLMYEHFGVKFFKNGVISSGILRHPGKLGDTAYQRLKEDFAKNYAGMANTGKPIILEEDMDFKELTMKLVDAQFLESKKFQLEDIARVYRVPLHLIQNLDRATNNNIEHQSLEFVMYTMLPWAKRWEENINLQLVSGQERKSRVFTEFKMDALLRGDAKSRAEAYAAGRQWGWLSVNDIRRLENINPIPNGDIYLQPLNMGEAGKIQVQDSIKALAEEIYNMITERK